MLTDTAKNLMLAALGADVDFCSLHSGIPDATGSNELTGGSPAYARKAIAWETPASGAMDKNSTDPVFDVPAGTDVFFIGLWDAVTSGNFRGFVPVNGGATRGVAAVANSGDVFTSYAHGLVNGNRVLLRAVVGSSLPTGLSATTLYYVVGITTDTFQVSTTLGGSAVAISADGECGFQKVTPESYGAQGTLTVDTAQLSLND